MESQIVWYRGSEALQAEDGLSLYEGRHGLASILEFRNPGPQHAGLYHCEATNALGRALSQVVHLTSNLPTPAPNHIPPSFIHAPENEIAGAGSRVVLRCEARGSPKPRIQWTKNGEKMVGQTNSRLVIDSLSQADVANYACNASNSAGYEYKNVIVNILTVSARITRGPPKELMVSRGSLVMLPCKVEGHPRPTVSWSKDGVPLKEGKKHLVDQDNGSLAVMEATEQDQGIYTCTASNQGTDAKSGKLIVKSITTIVNGPRDRVEVVFSSIKMNCSVVADMTQSLTVLWKKNNVDLGQVGFPRSERIETDENYGLSIKNLSFADSGTYTCVASTPTSMATDSGLLTVVGVGPSLEEDEDFVGEKLEGEPVLLPCKVSTGFPAPQITWFKDGAEVDERAGRSTEEGLHLEDLHPKDSGEYICRAQNSEGMVTKSVELVVRRKSRVVTVPTAMEWREGEEAIFHCEVEVDRDLEPSLSVQWFKGEDRLELMGLGDRVSLLPNSSLRIHRLERGDLGLYSCRVSTALEPNLRSAPSSLYLAAPLPWWLVLLLFLAATLVLLGLCLTLRLRGRFTKEQGYYGVADMERQGGVRDVCYTTTGGEKDHQQVEPVPPLSLTPNPGSANSLGSLISDELCLTEGQQEDGSFRRGYRA